MNQGCFVVSLGQRRTASKIWVPIFRPLATHRSLSWFRRFVDCFRGSAFAPRLRPRQGNGHNGLRGCSELFSRKLFSSARRRSGSHRRAGGASTGQTNKARGVGTCGQRDNFPKNLCCFVHKHLQVATSSKGFPHRPPIIPRRVVIIGFGGVPRTFSEYGGHNNRCASVVNKPGLATRRETTTSQVHPPPSRSLTSRFARVALLPILTTITTSFIAR